MNYRARIIENKVRYAECHGYTPADALLQLVQLVHIRKGATVRLWCAYWGAIGLFLACINIATCLNVTKILPARGSW